MNFKKKICGFILCLSLISAYKVNAISDDKIYSYNGNSVTGKELKKNICQSDEGNVVFPDSIKYGNQDIELYCVYSDNNEVLKEINNKFKNTIQLIKERYNISDDLNENNWEDYRESMLNIYNDYDDIDEQTMLDIATIDGDFDIYENAYENEKIISLTAKPKTRSAIVDNDIADEINLLTPNYSEILAPYSFARVAKNFNVSKASEYADKYATKRNSNYYYFHRGDCTNFASQILEYSGVKQVVYDSVGQGWWHKTEKQLIGVKHTHSQSWTMSNTFARYMGVYVRTTDITEWANGLHQGDFIALDKNNDGSWDHIGYVRDVSSNRYSHVDDPNNNMTISVRDVKIAQHTTDYNKWMSEKGNGWGTYYRKGAYGRVRG